MRLIRFVLAASILLPLGLDSRARGQCQTFDPSFHQSGFGNQVVKRAAVFDDGTGPAIYAVGYFDEVSGRPAQSIARFDGVHWQPVPGPTTFVTSFNCLHVWDDGTGPGLYCGGNPVASSSIAAIYKWDGSTWTALPAGPDYNVWALDDFGGSLYVGGEFTHVGGQLQRGIARWNGSSWGNVPGMVGGALYTFGVFDFQVFDDGSGPALFAAGQFDSAGGITSASIGKWDGTSWSAVTPIPLDYIWSLEVFDAGFGPELVAAGPGGQYCGVRRLHQGVWAPMAGGFSGFIDDLAVHDDGSGSGPQLYAAGLFTPPPPGTGYNVARWNGTAWTGVGTPPNQKVWDLLAEDPFGKGRLFAVGAFEYAGNAAVRRAAQWDGTEWAPTDVNTGVIGEVYTMASFDDVHGHSLYVGGGFSIAGNVFSKSVARWNGSAFESLGSGPDPVVYSLCAFDDGTGEQLYAGGYFPDFGRIARWSGTHWSALPGVFPFDTSFDPWTGQYQTFQTDTLLVFDDGTGPALYMGGKFVFGTTGGIARYRNGAWEHAGSLLSEVRALAVHDDGTGAALYAAGNFVSNGTSSLSHVAKWDGTQWLDVGGGVHGVLSSYDGVFALASFDDGSGPALYGGGTFTNAGGVPGTAYIARFRNGAWEAVGSGLAGTVRALTVHDDGTGAGPELYAGGYFTLAGGQAAKSLAKWNGTTWTPVDVGVTSVQGGAGTVLALGSWNNGASRDLYVGGQFAFAGAGPSPNFARWIGCGETGRLFCFGDGSGAACPCGNASMPGDRAGCLHSFGAGATLRATGEPSLSADSLVLHGAEMPSSAVLYFQGVGSAAGGAGVPFGDGLRCVSGPFVRLATKVNVNGVSTFPSGMDAGVAMRGGIHSPGLRTYQVRYRNSASFCTSDTFNLTNAVEISWTP